ncbi:MAG: hypothetical protein HYR72_06400 [Deltaproteobacteria bacterium]|nr:hypothetical protein [Deltaproteobacteria bacterium]MBI3387076.1 hypothetical protein [Deltaproteobacteria bacterium]
MTAYARMSVWTATALALAATSATAQNCGDIRALLQQGNSAQAVAQATGLSTADIESCRTADLEHRFFSPQGPAPHGAPGPAPHGAPGPAPHGAVGPAPHGAAGPAPFGER